MNTSESDQQKLKWTFIWAAMAIAFVSGTIVALGAFFGLAISVNYIELEMFGASALAAVWCIPFVICDAFIARHKGLVAAAAALLLCSFLWTVGWEIWILLSDAHNAPEADLGMAIIRLFSLHFVMFSVGAAVVLGWTHFRTVGKRRYRCEATK